MELNTQHCWELRNGQLHPVDDPTDGDGNVDENIAAAGYISEITSKFGNLFSGADVTLYKNASDSNGKPLFYLDLMGDKTGIAALVASDFKQLVETLNHLGGLLTLIRMDQSFAIECSTQALMERP